MLSFLILLSLIVYSALMILAWTGRIRFVFRLFISPAWVVVIAVISLIAIILTCINYKNASTIYAGMRVVFLSSLAFATTLRITNRFLSRRFMWWESVNQAMLMVLVFIAVFLWLFFSDLLMSLQYSLFFTATGAFLGILAAITIRLETQQEIFEGINQLRNHLWFDCLYLRHVFLFVILLIALMSTLNLILPVWDTSPWMDSNSYDTMAHQLALGKGFNSKFHMPLYIGWLSSLFYFFGHFYYVVQISNIVAILITIAIFYAAMRTWTGNTIVSLLTVSLMATSKSIIHSYVIFSQIETFNELLVAVNFYLFVIAFKRNRYCNGLLWGFSCALLLLCRLQNAGLIFGQFIVYLMMGWAKGWRILNNSTSMKQKVVVISVAIVGLLIPLFIWGVRNLVTEGQFRITTTATTWQLALGNHPDTRGGIDYRSYFHLQEEYMKKYPDPGEREKAYRRDGIRFLLEDPMRTLYNFWMRAKVFLGILEPGFWANRPTDWSKEWRGYLAQNYQSLLALTCFLLMVGSQHNRLSCVSIILVIAFLLPFLPFPSGETRVRFPIDHIFLLSIAVMLYYLFMAKKVEYVYDKVIEGEAKADSWPSLLSLAFTRVRRVLYGRLIRQKARRWTVAGIGILITFVLCRIFLGAPNANRLLKAAGATKALQVSMDNFPSSTRTWEDLLTETSKENVLGSIVEFEAVVLNQGWPAECIANVGQYFPQFCAERGNGCYQVRVLPRRPLNPGEPRFIYQRARVSLSYKGAVIERSLREGDHAWILGRVREIKDFNINSSLYPAIYIEVLKAKKIR